MIDFFEVQAAADQKDLDNGWYWMERGVPGSHHGPFASRAEARDDSLFFLVEETAEIVRRSFGGRL